MLPKSPPPIGFNHRQQREAKVEDLRSDLKPRGRPNSFVLDHAAFGGATPVEPKAISATDPAARYTAAVDKPC